jgi:hypothetical protein
LVMGQGCLAQFVEDRVHRLAADRQSVSERVSLDQLAARLDLGLLRNTRTLPFVLAAGSP